VVGVVASCHKQLCIQTAREKAAHCVCWSDRDGENRR